MVAMARQVRGVRGVRGKERRRRDHDGDGGYTAADDLDQDRTHNDPKKITGITEQSDPQQSQWADPAYSARGNMTTIPKPNDLENTVSYTHLTLPTN